MNPARLSEWALFYKLFASLLAAGYSPAESLSQLMQEPPSQRLQRRLRPLLATLSPDASLPYYLKLPVFGLDSATIGLFEKTARVDEHVALLHALSARYSQANWVNQLRGVSLYWPLMYLFFGGFVFSVISIFVLPAFSSLYESFGMELPFKTTLLLTLWPWLFLLTLLLIVFSIMLYFRPVWLRPLIDGLVLILPLRSLVKKIALARFTHMLALLLSKNLPVRHAIIMAISAADNTLIERRLQRDFVSMPPDSLLPDSQLSVADALKSCLLIPAGFIAALHIAEKTNRLKETMPELIGASAGLLARYTSILNNTADTVIKIWAAVLLGWVAIAVYEPIFKIGSMI